MPSYITLKVLSGMPARRLTDGKYFQLMIPKNTILAEISREVLPHPWGTMITSLAIIHGIPYSVEFPVDFLEDGSVQVQVQQVQGPEVQGGDPDPTNPNNGSGSLDPTSGGGRRSRSRRSASRRSRRSASRR